MYEVAAHYAVWEATGKQTAIHVICVMSLGFSLMLLVRSHVDARPDVMDLPVTQAPNVTVSP